MAVFVTATIPCASLLVSTGCAGDGSDAGATPLGWGGPVTSREERLWSRESIDSAPRWTVAEGPAFVVVPDARGADPQREFDEAAIDPDGRVVIFLSPDHSKQESILLHVVDPSSGEEFEVSAPKGEDGQSLNWSHFGMVAHDGGIVLDGDNRGGRRQDQDIWYFDREGQLARPPFFAPRGKVLGLFPDGSLVIAGVAGSTGSVDTLLVSAIMSVPAAEAGNEPMSAHEPEVLFLTAIPKDPTLLQFDYPARGGHFPWHSSGLAGDTIWTVPTERPELLAVHRSGEVVLKVQWETGDRTIPPEADAFGRGAERYPAVRSLEIGTDGLIYVEEFFLRDGRLVSSPEWLVFSPVGELLARLVVPGNQRVLAVGDGVLVTTGENEVSGANEVRYYELTRTR